ncbi:hypothetical protein [Halovivax gelatinilyticus]|uniref:hypothetical protein n=1 Tax=Halovivax gelatinilyticus TaxID=2961597 RepID=UPI0020CA89E1|nr:hypothetical protein [Halovivax gelatinilyticus]
MNVTDRQLKGFYLFGVALNTGALVYSIDTGEYLFAGTFAFILLYLGFRYRMVAQS